MRVLFITTQVCGHGGIQYAGRLFVRALVDSLPSAENLTVNSLLDSTEQLRQSLPSVGWGAAGSRLRFSLAVLRNLLFGHWDQVILGHANLAPLLLMCHRRHRRVVGFIYGLEAWRPLSRFRRLGLRRCQELFYISDYSRHAAQAENPWLAKLDSQILYLGLLSDSNATPPQAKTVTDRLASAPYALAIGRMSSGERYKGFDELIQIWSRVNLVHPQLRLRIIGTGDDRPRLEQLAHSAGATVDFLGSVSDEERDINLANCLLFCLPSRGEGFGLVYLEAMKEHKAVLAGSLDAGKEVVADRVSGRVVDARQPDQLYDALLDVIANYESYGAAARARYVDQFSYSAFLSRFNSLVLPASR